MKTESLVRIKEVKEDPEAVSFADQLWHKLGYAALSHHIAEKGIGSPLAKTLLELGIEPFTNESVTKYKKEARERMAFAYRHPVWTCGLLLVIWAALLGTPMFFAIKKHDPWLLVFDLASAVVGLGSCCAFFPENNWRWRTQYLKDYRQPIPEFVLRKALQICEKLPDARFFVDSLVKEERYADPFLAVEHHGEVLYIEVWDEPKFERAL